MEDSPNLLPVQNSDPLELTDEGAFDKSNPRSLINLLPSSIQESLERCQNQFLQDQSQESLRKNIAHMKEYGLVKSIRQSFWMEYNKALETGRRMRMTRVWEGITSCSGEFYQIMKKDHFAAFIFTRPMKQDVAERELLELATARMFNILEASPYRKKKNPETKEWEDTPELDALTAKVQIDLFKHLDERVQGGIIKQVATKVESKTTNININQETKTLDASQFKKMEELTARLAELREKTQDIESTAYIVVDDDSEE